MASVTVTWTESTPINQLLPYSLIIKDSTGTVVAEQHPIASAYTATVNGLPNNATLTVNLYARNAAGFSRPATRTITTPPQARPWEDRDTSVPNAATGRFFIAGGVYGDPGGYRDAQGVITVREGGTLSLARSGTQNPSITQFGNAGRAIGATARYDRNPSGQDRCTLTNLPAMTIPTHSTPQMLVGATGPQVRAFLAAVMQGEGNVNGMVIDDPDARHGQVMAQQMSKVEAFGVPIHDDNPGGNFHHFFLDNLTRDAPKVQAYPFATYGRCPGGSPVGGSIGSGGSRTQSPAPSPPPSPNPSPPNPSPPSPDPELAVVSFNVSHGRTNTEIRKDIVELIDRGADVICLQECGEDHWAAITGIPGPFTPFKPADPSQPQPILYNANKCNFIGGGSRWVSAAQNVEFDASLNMDTVAAKGISYIRFGYAGYQVSVMNMHAIPGVEHNGKPDTRHPKRLEVYGKMMDAMRQEVNERAAATGAVSVIVCGDLNADYHNDNIERSPRFPWWNMDAVNVRSSYRALGETSTGTRGGRKIDYVAHLVGRNTTPDRHRVLEAGTYGGDHEPLWVVYRMNG